MEIHQKKNENQNFYMSQPHSSWVSILASVTDFVEGYRVVRPSAGPGL